MKLEQLRKLIREEARKVIKEEIEALLPQRDQVRPKESIQEHFNSLPKGNEKQPGFNPIENILQEIRQDVAQGRTRLDSFSTSTLNRKPTTASGLAFSMGMNETQGIQPGLDISQFNWAKKAGEVYKKSVEKDKEKYGIV